MHWRDRIHSWATNAVFVGLVVFNHKMGLELTVGDLCVLAAVLGLSQLQMIMQVLKGGPPDAPTTVVQVNNVDPPAP